MHSNCCKLINPDHDVQLITRSDLDNKMLTKREQEQYIRDLSSVACRKTLQYSS
jgi:hypothetical protein